MNKKTIFTALLTLVALAGQAQNLKWCLEGTVDNVAPNDTLTIIDSERHQPIATIQVKNGAIAPASGVLEKPAVCRIAKKGRRGSIGIFVLEEGTTKISIDLDKAYVLKVGDIARKHPDHALSPYLIDWCQLLFTHCLDAFPCVPPKPHSRQPSLSGDLLGVAIGEVSQAEDSARRLSGRYSLSCLLANPLPCHSLRLVPRVWYDKKDSPTTKQSAVRKVEKAKGQTVTQNRLGN